MNVNPEHYRVAIFGSSRIEKEDGRYEQVYNLAKKVASEGFDVVTGGGPSLMDAASRGHHAGRSEDDDLHSIGLTINVADEREGYHLDIKEEFEKFSGRLDSFMELSDVVVVAPGGIGTMLELFYTWQLVQVKQLCETPIILMGERWQGLIEWIVKEIVEEDLMDEKDLEYVFVVDDEDQAFELIRKVKEDYDANGHVCKNWNKYD